MSELITISTVVLCSDEFNFNLRELRPTRTMIKDNYHRTSRTQVKIKFI